MNVRTASVVFAAALSLGLASANACRFCNAGPNMDRYTTTDPMNSAPFDALVEQYRDATPLAPKPEEIVTSKDALARAAATATPQPGAEIAPITPNSFRSRLLREVPARTAIAPAPAAAVTAIEGVKVKPLGEWTSRAVDFTLVVALVGVALFFGRGLRRQTASF